MNPFYFSFAFFERRKHWNDYKHDVSLKKILFEIIAIKKRQASPKLHTYKVSPRKLLKIVSIK